MYKDRTVQMETQFQKFSTGIFASAGQLVWNRFTGPGRVGIQCICTCRLRNKAAHSSDPLLFDSASEAKARSVPNDISALTRRYSWGPSSLSTAYAGSKSRHLRHATTVNTDL